MSSEIAVERRLEELEVRLSFIDDSLSQLLDADAGRAMRIAALERMVRELRGELATLRQDAGGDPRQEPPPPHY